MPWFKVDDGLHSSRKVLSIPRASRLAAVGLWTLAGSWSAHQELDGLIPDYMVPELGGTQKLVDALVVAGLWTAVDGGSQFHKWAEYQPTRAELEASRTKEAERKRLWRERQKVGTDAGVPPGHDAGRDAESEYPDPTRPDPTPLTTSPDGEVVPRKRATRIPDNFVVDADMAAWARERCPLVDGRTSTERFINYWSAKSGKDATKLDWPATWRNWLLNDQERLARNPQRKQTPEERMLATLALASEDPKEIAS